MVQVILLNSDFIPPSSILNSSNTMGHTISTLIFLTPLHNVRLPDGVSSIGTGKILLVLYPASYIRLTRQFGKQGPHKMTFPLQSNDTLLRTDCAHLFSILRVFIENVLLSLSWFKWFNLFLGFKFQREGLLFFYTSSAVPAFHNRSSGPQLQSVVKAANIHLWKYSLRLCRSLLIAKLK